MSTESVEKPQRVFFCRDCIHLAEITEKIMSVVSIKYFCKLFSGQSPIAVINCSEYRGGAEYGKRVKKGDAYGR